MSRDAPWLKIFEDHGLLDRDFGRQPFVISAEQIKVACHSFTKTGEREVRVLCKQDTRESRPKVFKDRGLFLLPVTNSSYVIVKGEGYVDIPTPKEGANLYVSQLDFDLDTSLIGDSEAQHVDFAYASSLIRTILDDDSLVLTIRGRKYTPSFAFRVGPHEIEAKGVQTEVDAGYEGRNQVVLLEAKSGRAKNTIIRQLYYPYRQWQEATQKPVYTLFFEKQGDLYNFWKFKFNDHTDYNSIELTKTWRYLIEKPNRGESN
jgi:hypothetical protein